MSFGISAAALQRLADGDADVAEDVFGGATAGEVVDGFGHALDDGAEGGGAAEALDQFVADVAGLEVGEDEDVGVALDGAAGVLLQGDGGDDGGVGLDFAVDHGVELEFLEAGLGEAGGLGDLVDEFVLGGALGGEGEEGDLGLLADEGAEGAGGGQGDVDHLLGGRAGVDGAVGEAEDVVAGGGGFAQAHEEGGGGQLDARGRADALEGRAEHVAGGGDRAGDEAVGFAGGEHHGAEVDALVEQGLAGAFGGHAFGLALLVEGLGEFVEQRALGVVDHLRGGHQPHAGGVFGEGDLLGRAQDDDVGDVLLQRQVGGLDDARVLALGEDDGAAGAFGLRADLLQQFHDVILSLGNGDSVSIP